MFTSPRGRRKIFLQHRKSIVGPQWIFPDVEVVRRCPRSAVSLMIVCAQTRFQTLVVDGLGRSQVGGPTRRLARSSGPVTATGLIIEVAHGATRWHDGAGVAMPANRGVVMSRHVPPPRCNVLSARGIGKATVIGNCHRESDSAVDPLGLSSVYPRGGVGARWVGGQVEPAPGIVLTCGEHY